MKKSGGIYARFSPGRDRDKTSTIDAQVAMCREKALGDGVVIDESHVYADRGVSGKSMEREGFQSVLSAIEDGRFPDVLYVKDDKRLFRNEREAGEVTDWIWESGVEIRYCLLGFGDPRASDEQWLLQRQLHILAEWERRQKAKEVFEHQRQNALRGFRNGGPALYGYRRAEVMVLGDDGTRRRKITWEVDETEVGAVRLAFEMRLAGKGLKAIATALTRRGYLSRGGKMLGSNSVQSWFKNPFRFAGCLVWNQHDQGQQLKPRSEWVIVEGAYPGIISMEMAEKIWESRKVLRKRVVSGKYLLTGILRCAECNGAFVMNASLKRNQFYYKCGTRSRKRLACGNGLQLEMHRIEKLVMDEVRTVILQEGVLEAYFERLKTEGVIEGREAEIERLHGELARLDSRVEAFVDALGDREIPREMVRKKIGQCQAERRKVVSELRRFSGLRADVDLVALREGLSVALEDGEMRKVALEGVIRQVMVRRDGGLDVEYVVGDTHTEGERGSGLWIACEYQPGKRPSFS